MVCVDILYNTLHYVKKVWNAADTLHSIMQKNMWNVANYSLPRSGNLETFQVPGSQDLHPRAHLKIVEGTQRHYAWNQSLLYLYQQVLVKSYLELA